jgi:hypothetical protein
MFGRKSLIDSLFPLLFLDAPDSGSGGGLGDVADVPLGHAGDVSILEQGGDDDDADDDADADEGDDDGDVGDDGEGDEDEPEVFDDADKKGKGDEDEDEEEQEDKGDDKEDKEIFEGRPTLTDIKKVYPKIFKQFPELRDVLFREQEFGKHFGTVEEAQEASVYAQSFRQIEASLLAGDSSPIIEQLRENDPDALVRVADNFLPTLLAKGGENLYLRATVPIIEQFLWTVHEHGKTSGNANLVNAARHAANYIFGKPEIPDPNRRKGEQGPHPAERKLEDERKAWAETRFKEASSEVSAAIDTELDADIGKGLDPDKKLTQRQRSRLIQDIKDEIDATLRKDQAFGRQMKALWAKAADASYPKDQRASIKSAFLARAKALVPSVRSRLRAEWFGEKAPVNNDKSKNAGDKKQQDAPKKRTLPDAGRSGSGGPKRPPSPKEVDYSKTTDEDLIAGRFTRKRA